MGEAIEALFPDQLEEEAHRLAYHFFEGRDRERALEYYTMAGDHAARIYANVEAVESYSRAIRIARRVGASSARLIHLYIHRGRTFEICGRYDDAVVNYQELESLARDKNDRALALIRFDL